MILNFGPSPRALPPTHRIFSTWEDVGDTRGAKWYINGFSSVDHRKFTSTKETTCYQFAERLLQQKGINDKYYAPLQATESAFTIPSGQ